VVDLNVKGFLFQPTLFAVNYVFAAPKKQKSENSTCVS